MDDLRVGAAHRALRRRRGLSQSDVAAAAGLSQATISNLEQGRLRGMTIDTVRRAFAALDAGFEGAVRWRGAALDRVLDAAHTALVGASVALLQAAGWTTLVEVSYSIYGERGSVDVLAGFDGGRVVLVDEVKSTLVEVGDTVRKLDEKARLVRERIARERFGREPEVVSRMLILPATTTARRSVARWAPVLDAALPDRGDLLRRWLRDPGGSGIAGILFVPVERRDR